MASSPPLESAHMASQTSSHADALTPSRKVQALLSRFDDSDSDEERQSLEKTNQASSSAARQSGPFAAEDESEDEDIIAVASKSRMASRLQGLSKSTQVSVAVDDTIKEYGSVKRRLETDEDHSNVALSSEDELSRPAPRRRFLLKRKSSPVHASSTRQRASRSASPLFFPSPHTGRDSTPSLNRNETELDDLFNSVTPGTNSKFLALVEKHRKQRLEKEAAESAKKEANAMNSNEQTVKPRKQRGSSPADDTHEDSEDSNVDAAKKLTSEARPSRKASKKALEEMNRETQRMSRNMQLAHQARTKKKITKESFLAKFSFSLPEVVAIEDVTKPSATSSSAPPSDAETNKTLTTPPTSPLHRGFSDKELDQTVFNPTLSDPSIAPRLENDEAPLQLAGRVDENKGKGRAADWIPTAAADVTSMQTQVRNVQHNSISSLKSSKARLRREEWLAKMPLPTASDDDSDLDIVTAKGDTRKYVVFERLPKHKAKETQSHIALRSLAHLVGTDDKKRSSMTASEMEASLRKAARLQAREERRQKIEELKAKGVVIQTAEERERDQQDVEDIVERARQEAAEISKRERELAKKDGTFVKDGLDDDDDSDGDDGDFQEDHEEGVEDGDSDEEETGDDDDADEDSTEETENPETMQHNFVDAEADEQGSAEESEETSEEDTSDGLADEDGPTTAFTVQRKSRNTRIVSDEEDETADHEVRSPQLPALAKTPQSLVRSARKQIPGLQMSDDPPLGLTQAFAATMADSQSQTQPETQEEDSLAMTRDLPSPNIPFAPRLNRLDSIDMVSDSQPASQTQALNVNLSFSQSQKVPESPAMERDLLQTQFTPSQMPFEPTQDEGYMFSPFYGNRFATETPQRQGPRSTIETVILPNQIEDSPIVQRKGRLRRGRVDVENSEDDIEVVGSKGKSVFEVMKRAAKKTEQLLFDKTKSHAKEIVDEAAEESEDEYAGLGGASDDDNNDVENDEDRQMIDEDTQVGRGDEAKLAGLFADRERQEDEAAVSKLLKDITTGALRRKRGANDDLDLSDEEDANARRREAKRREFAKMRRELLKDEAVGKIAEDKKKQAFLRSIEDREALDDDEDDFDQPETPLEESQELSLEQNGPKTKSQQDSEHGEISLTGQKRKYPFNPTSDSQLNQVPPALRRSTAGVHKKPATLAEIRESVSFLIDEPDSQAASIDLGLSDSEDEPEAYVNLDRHFKEAEADENASDDSAEDLGDFIVDDDGLAKDKDTSQDDIFKKPRLPFSERRTKDRTNVVNRLDLKRQSSSSSSSSTSSATKMAFLTSKSETSLSKVPTLLRRATSNSRFGVGKDENISATGVVTSTNTSKTERGDANDEKEFVRKGMGGRRNAVNYRPTVKEERMSERAGVAKKGKAKNKKGGSNGFLGGLFRSDSWG